MNWFKDVFIPSLEKKMNNPKYPNQCILSDKQADICRKYMRAVYCRSDYSGFYNYEIVIDNKYYQMTSRGKYHFLTMIEK